jgi:hypothetical protein
VRVVLNWALLARMVRLREDAATLDRPLIALE